MSGDVTSSFIDSDFSLCPHMGKRVLRGLFYKSTNSVYGDLMA